uniref:G-protein coupled receptors family 1 profile domain-containing protein n=1 Tax=Acrobeloides nanus TaxID=290746 RepID=A0A914BZG7_9BILA
MNRSKLPCTNETIRYGICHGMPICGFCYDYGEYRKPSREYELYNLIVIGTILPIIGLMGLMGNAISGFIYSRKLMRSSMNMYLAALAISDTTIIITAFFLFFLESLRRRNATLSKLFAILSPITFPLGLTAQTLSVYFTIAAALDCFVLVFASDVIKQRFCTRRTAKWMISCIIVLASIFNSPHLFEIYVISCWSIPYSQQLFDVCPSALRQNQAYFTIYYAYLYTIFMAVGPMVLLVVLNTAIIIVMRQSYTSAAVNSSNRTDSDVFTLVLVVCLFVTCNILPLTVNFLELLFDLINTYLIDLSNLMVVLNSSCNFLIYYAFGSQFRRTLKQYIAHFLGRGRRELVESEGEILSLRSHTKSTNLSSL